MSKQNYTKEDKIMIIDEVKEIGNRALVARKYNLSESTIRTWEKKFNDEKFNTPNLNYNKLLKENEKLKNILGEKELEISILKDLNRKKF